MLISFVFTAIIVLTWQVYGQQVTPAQQNRLGVKGESVQFQWTVDKGNESISLTLLEVYNGTEIDTNRQLYTLSRSKLTKIENVTDRLNANIEGSFYTDTKIKLKLILENIQYNDNGVLFFVAAQFRRPHLKEVTAIGTLVKVNGGPDFCQGHLPTIFTFDDNSSPRIIINVCGIPQPKVKGEFMGQKLNVKDATVNSYTHSFMLQLPLLTQTACGREVQVTTTGYNGTSAGKTKIFVKNFKPHPVNIDHFLQSEKFGCNRRVQWQPIDTGTCPVEYNIQFRDNSYTIVGTVIGIKSNVNIFCTDDYANSTSVTMWATHNGVKGNESQIELLHNTRKPLVTEAKGHYKWNGVGIGIGIGIGICIFIFVGYKAFSYFWLQKTETKKNVSRKCSGSSSDQNIVNQAQYSEILVGNSAKHDCQNIYRNTGRHSQEENVEERNVMEAYQDIQSYVPMQAILPFQSTCAKQMNRADFLSHPPSNCANQLVPETKSYATLHSIELSRGEYQQLRK